MDERKYPFKATNNMMQEHLKLTSIELTHIIEKRSEASIRSFDAIVQHAVEMGKHLS
jgi:hypothetical protein